MEKTAAGLTAPSEFLLHHSLQEFFPRLARYRSSRKLYASKVYRLLEPEIGRVMNGIEYGLYAPHQPLLKKSFYRMVAWNVERGMNFEGVVDILKNHAEISKADVLFLPETDVGMARTHNRNVARDLALALGLNYFFSPAYLNLGKGNSIESHVEGENTLALHGNALLSRYPLENLRIIPLKNCKDKMSGKEKRIGRQSALVADVLFPFRKITVVAVHLDAHSSQRQRARQLETILASLKGNRHPVFIGGDFNSNCYNTRRAVTAFFGFWNKVFRGVDTIIENHYTYPDRYFDRFLFACLRAHGFDYANFNEEGMGTLHYQAEDIRGNNLVQEVIPAWCRRIMEETLKRHGGKVSLKLDWFAGRGIKAVGARRWISTSGAPDAVSTANGNVSLPDGASFPKVIPGLRYREKMISDHDPILADVDIY